MTFNNNQQSNKATATGHFQLQMPMPARAMGHETF
jgi:hypothetical protein